MTERPLAVGTLLTAMHSKKRLPGQATPGVAKADGRNNANPMAERSYSDDTGRRTRAKNKKTVRDATVPVDFKRCPLLPAAPRI